MREQTTPLSHLSSVWWMCCNHTALWVRAIKTRILETTERPRNKVSSTILSSCLCVRVRPSGENSGDPCGASLPLHSLAGSRSTRDHRAPHQLQAFGQRTHEPVLQTLSYCGPLQVRQNTKTQLEHTLLPSLLNCFIWYSVSLCLCSLLRCLHSVLVLDVQAPSSPSTVCSSRSRGKT